MVNQKGKRRGLRSAVVAEPKATPKQTRYRNHFAVPASEIMEGDFVFDRIVTEVIDYEEGLVQIRMADNSLAVAKPSEKFPVQFAQTHDPGKTFEQWTFNHRMPKCTKMEKWRGGTIVAHPVDPIEVPDSLPKAMAVAGS